MEISKFSKHFEFDFGSCNNLVSLVNAHDRQPLRSPSLLSCPLLSASAKDSPHAMHRDDLWTASSEELSFNSLCAFAHLLN